MTVCIGLCSKPLKTGIGRRHGLAICANVCGFYQWYSMDGNKERPEKQKVQYHRIAIFLDICRWIELQFKKINTVVRTKFCSNKQYDLRITTAEVFGSLVNNHLEENLNCSQLQNKLLFYTSLSLTRLLHPTSTYRKLGIFIIHQRH